MNRNTNIIIQDWSEKMWTLMDKRTDAQSNFTDTYMTYRSVLKEIRSGEENLYKLRTAEKTLQDRVKESVKKQKPVENVKLELESASKLVQAAEARQYNEKRQLLAKATAIQCQAMLEMSLRVLIS